MHAITWADQARAYRAIISAEIERLINLLDEADGDPDAEDGDEDRCSAFDDDPKAPPNWLHGPGDDEDAEDDDPLEVAALKDVRAVMEPPRDWGRAWNASIRGEDMEDSHDREMEDPLNFVRSKIATRESQPPGRKAGALHNNLR